MDKNQDPGYAALLKLCVLLIADFNELKNKGSFKKPRVY
jgi:hypothetical protein